MSNDYVWIEILQSMRNFDLENVCERRRMVLCLVYDV